MVGVKGVGVGVKRLWGQGGRGGGVKGVVGYGAVGDKSIRCGGVKGVGVGVKGKGVVG